jgi:hypothetical protein
MLDVIHYFLSEALSGIQNKIRLLAMPIKLWGIFQVK